MISPEASMMGYIASGVFSGVVELIVSKNRETPQNGPLKKMDDLEVYHYFWETPMNFPDVARTICGSFPHDDEMQAEKNLAAQIEKLGSECFGQVNCSYLLPP